MTVALDIPAARKQRELEQTGQQQGKLNGQAAPPSAITPIDFASLPDAEPPRRRFLVDQWLPDGCLSSLYGPGGIGKSLLAQQLATCIATGRGALGAAVERAPVLGLFAEDDDGEMIRRQWRINQALGLQNRDLAELHIQGRAGLKNTLATFPMGSARVEALYEATIRKAQERAARLVMLDNRAQLLLVNENDRCQATFAANLCAGIAREINGAVLLLGHVAKGEGSEYSGSTAWDAVTRSRWWLRRAADGGDGAPELNLERVKSNYAQPDAMRLVWTDGVLRPADERHMTDADRLERQLRKGAACQAFLDALDVLTIQGRPVSHSNRARNYAPRCMAEMAGDFSARELEQAMAALFADHRIQANAPVVRGGDRKWKTGIARAGAGDIDAT